MVVGNSKRIPHFLVAGSPKGLQRLMLLNNLNNGFEHNYFSIQKDGSKWIAWYYAVATVEVPDGILKTVSKD